MSTNTTQNTVIADIEPPLPPVPQSQALGISIAVTVILLLAALLLVRYRQTPRSRARRALYHLENHLHTKTVNQRQISYQLPALLRQGLRLHQLSNTQQLPDSLSSQQTRWQIYIAKLDEARYARTEPSIDTLKQLTDETRYWLRQWP